MGVHGHSEEEKLQNITESRFSPGICSVTGGILEGGDRGGILHLVEGTYFDNEEANKYSAD